LVASEDVERQNAPIQKYFGGWVKVDSGLVQEHPRVKGIESLEEEEEALVSAGRLCRLIENKEASVSEAFSNSSLERCSYERSPEK
jgi:hypothetical protein